MFLLQIDLFSFTIGDEYFFMWFAYNIEGH